MIEGGLPLTQHRNFNFTSRMFGWNTASHKVDDYVPMVRGMLQRVMDQNPNLCARGPDAFVRALSRYIHNSRTIPQDLKVMLQQEHKAIQLFGIDRIWKEVRITVDHPDVKAYAHFVAQMVFNNQEFKEACASNDTDLQLEILLEKIRRVLFLYFNKCVSTRTAPYSKTEFSKKTILVWRGGQIGTATLPNTTLECSFEDKAEGSYFQRTGREEDRFFHPHRHALIDEQEEEEKRIIENAEAIAGFFKKHGLNKKIENKFSSKFSSWLSRKKRKSQKTRHTRRNRRSSRMAK